MLVRPLTSITLVLLAAGSAWARPSLSQAQIATLEQGKALESTHRVPGTKVTAGKAVLIVNDNPESVLWVFMQLDKYKAFLPRIKDSRMVKQKGYDAYAVVETDLPWPVKDCWAYVKYTRRDKGNRTFQVSFSMVNGNLKSYTGEAHIEPWNKEGTKTLLSYEMLFEPNTAAPDSMISDGVRQAASIMVQKIRLRLMALRKFGKMPKGY